ncbi:hypothetical protein [Janthinobacterium sp. UMAB-60]|uniref:hypothetical protein n=1 Tax=Janthinobacterium sp. UMAB-60 TaxID=1365365 RepID=UPI001C568EB6|nr:hypothetical protein [Janthinobacterium sp. UMAB-60]
MNYKIINKKLLFILFILTPCINADAQHGSAFHGAVSNKSLSANMPMGNFEDDSPPRSLSDVLNGSHAGDPVPPYSKSLRSNKSSLATQQKKTSMAGKTDGSGNAVDCTMKCNDQLNPVPLTPKEINDCKNAGCEDYMFNNKNSNKSQKMKSKFQKSSDLQYSGG